LISRYDDWSPVSTKARTSGGALVVVDRPEMDDEQQPRPRALVFDESRSEAKADRAAADFRKSYMAGVR
jgi:hypothetical protein